LVSHSFVCMHYFLCVLTSPGVNIHTRTRVYVDGIDTDKDVFEERTNERGKCTQN